MRLLVLSPNTRHRWNWGHQLFRDEISRQYETVNYGHGFEHRGEFNVQKILDKLGPFDAILSWDQSKCGQYESMAEIKGIVKVIVLVDYLPHTAEKMDQFIVKHAFHLAFARSTLSIDVMNENKRNGVAALKKVDVSLLPWGVDTTRYKDFGWERPVDVSFISSLVSWAYPKRPGVMNAIAKLDCTKVLEGRGYKSKLKWGAYIEALNRTKIFVNANGKYNCMTMKYMEAMACGALLLTDKPRDFELLGFKDGVNCVLYIDVYDLRSKIRHYLENPELLKRIAENGRDFAHRQHSNAVRVKEMGGRIWEKIPG